MDNEIGRASIMLSILSALAGGATMRVNPTRPPPPNMKRMPDGTPFPMPNFDFSKMTPAQRQKIQRTMRSNPQFRRRQQAQPTPAET